MVCRSGTPTTFLWKLKSERILFGTKCFAWHPSIHSLSSDCHEARRSLVQHERVLAELYAAFSNVAAHSPEHSWRGSEAKFSVAELLSGKRGNRVHHKAVLSPLVRRGPNVDMGSAILLMSVAEAQRLGTTGGRSASSQ